MTDRIGEAGTLFRCSFFLSARLWKKPNGIRRIRRMFDLPSELSDPRDRFRLLMAPSLETQPPPPHQPGIRSNPPVFPSPRVLCQPCLEG